MLAAVVNVAMLVLAATLVVLWFVWHLQPYWAVTAYAAVVAIVVGIAKTFNDILKLGYKEKLGSLLRSRLGRWSSTLVLVWLLICLLPPFFFTSSLYFYFEGARPGEAHFDIEVYHAGNPYLPAASVSSIDRSYGRPFFPRFRDEELVVHVKGSQRYQPDTIIIGPLRHPSVLVPRQFRPKSLYPVCFVTGRGLMTSLPYSRDRVEKVFALRMDLGDEQRFIDTLLCQEIIAGAAEDDLKALLESDEDEALKDALITYLQKEYFVPPAQAAQWLQVWEANRDIVGTRELTPGDSLRLTVIDRADSSIVTEKVYQVLDTEGVQVVFIEMER